MRTKPILSCAASTWNSRIVPAGWVVSRFFSLAMLFLMSSHAWAQWQTQTITLKPGWNAVFLHVDPSHLALEEGIGSDAGNPIQEVWLWKPVVTPDRFTTNPQQPIASSDWSSWKRSAPASGTLARLIGNAAYLVRNGGTVDYVWAIKGKTVPPSYDWTSKGVNLIGFSTPETGAKFFSSFLAPVPRLASEGEFFRYDDGNNDLTPTLFNGLFHRLPVTRGQAYWIRHENEFNSYYGAFEVTLQNFNGIHFGSSGSQQSLRVRNLTASEIILTLNLMSSEAPPVGQPEIAGLPPLLLRGSLNATSLTYGSTPFAAGAQLVTLKPRGQPGAEAELVLGVNRAAMTGNSGSTFGGILRLTDSLGYSQIDLPVSASPASTAGLWVGDALVSQVRHNLKKFERDSSGQPVQSDSGKYVLTNTVKTLGSVPRPFNLRLIVHKSAGEARLLQRVYHGLSLSTNTILTTREHLLHPDLLESARRISAAHLPFTDGNAGWAFSGLFERGQSMNARVNVSFDDYGSNPFLHSFHPDHDNLDASFESAEPRGAESYDVERRVFLNFAEAGSDFGSLVAGGNQMSGRYTETITFRGRGDESLRIDTAGSFVLRRISEKATLITQ